MDGASIYYLVIVLVGKGVPIVLIKTSRIYARDYEQIVVPATKRSRKRFRSEYCFIRSTIDEQIMKIFNIYEYRARYSHE